MMYKEIGGEFWNITISNDENHLFDGYSFFISGRAALDFIIKDIRNKHTVKTACLPSWCCDTMIKPFVDNGLDISFYAVTYQNGKLIKEKNVEADIVLDLDYFGYKNDELIIDKGIVIKDISHSLFSNQKINADYVFGSLRKWTGIKTGGYAYCKDGFSLNPPSQTMYQYYNLRQRAMQNKGLYIEEDLGNKSYLDIFNEAEEMLEGLYEYKAHDKDVEDMKHLDVELIRNKRKENATYLLNELKDYAMFKVINKNDCPLFVPILVKNRDKLRKHLIENNIYCPIHWPISKLHKLADEEKQIYNHELSIICDQRYSVKDMEFICKTIKEFGAIAC